ncbi:hypothetical protein ACJMK2_042967 [Sinanodonta woodiana]|uniref:Ig-like domain-containing protein n=1 Tax=Sinanodonta woodiana TaxID=1069815 RepID=A0ABD3VX66_SINWO
MNSLPVIVWLGPDMLIPIGQYAVLQCDVRSIPKAAVEWVKDDRVITDSTNFVVKEYPQEEFTSSLILWIHKVTREHVGDYICRARNKYGIVVGRISIYGMQSANFAGKDIEVISQQRSNADVIDFDGILTFFLTAIAVVCKFE